MIIILSVYNNDVLKRSDGRLFDVHSARMEIDDGYTHILLCILLIIDRRISEKGGVGRTDLLAVVQYRAHGRKGYRRASVHEKFAISI